MEVALAYDSVYDLMSDAERQIARDGMFRNMIVPCQRGYVEDSLVTNDTSNWVAHVTGGSLTAQAAIFADGPDGTPVEPYLTGTIFKLHDLIQKSIGRDGGYGESAGYCYFTMQSLSKVLPALENVFKVDLSGNLHLTYTDMLWAGLIKKKHFFYFGDSGGGAMRPMTSWTWLLAKDRDPKLAWLFNHLKDGETLMDVLHNVDGTPGAGPVRREPGPLLQGPGDDGLQERLGRRRFRLCPPDRRLSTTTSTSTRAPSGSPTGARSSSRSATGARTTTTPTISPTTPSPWPTRRSSSTTTSRASGSATL